MRALRRFWTGLVWLYTGAVVGWWLLQLWFGDRIWWVALINALAPFLFAPLFALWPVDWLLQRRQRWWPLLIPTLLFLGLYGKLFTPAWPVQKAPNSPTLSVMTFNIWGGSYQQQSTQVIQENGPPDIVAIQELRPLMIRLLLPVLAPNYPYHLLDGRGTGMGIFSRYPLTPQSVNFRLQPDWQLQVARVQVQGRTFTLYHCHPPSTNIFAFLHGRQVGQQEVERSLHLRQLFVEKLLADIQTRSGPILVMGDLNSPPNSDVHQMLLTQLSDAHLQAGWGLGHTFPVQRNRSLSASIPPRLTRLDMILYSRDFVALQSHVGPSHGESDHLPVLATLTWR